MKNNFVGATLAVAQNNAIARNTVTRAGASPAPTINRITIGDIVGAYKSLVSKEGLNISKSIEGIP